MASILNRIYRPFKSFLCFLMRLLIAIISLPLNFCKCILGIIILLLKITWALFVSFLKFLIPKRQASVKEDVVMITGITNALGVQLAQQYGELGATIICVDLDRRLVQKLYEELQERKFNVYAYTCDLTKRSSVFNLAETIFREVGLVTILINNIVVVPSGKIGTTHPDEINFSFQINVFSHFWLVDAFLPSMIESNCGHIVAVSSYCGLEGIPYFSAYAASKFALTGFMRCLRQEIRTRNIRVYTTIVYVFGDDFESVEVSKRYQWLLPKLTPEKAAAEVIRAQRLRIEERSVPRLLLTISRWAAILPVKVNDIIFDTLEYTKRGRRVVGINDSIESSSTIM